MKSKTFEKVLLPKEKLAWKATKEVITGILGKTRSDNYRKSVEDMLKHFGEIGVHMSLKIHFLDRHLDVLEKQLSTESDEQGERYHQIAMPFEKRYIIYSNQFVFNYSY